MNDAHSNEQSDGCPHINRNDPRCGDGFRLTGLSRAFGVCLGAFNGCPMYHRLNSELKRNARAGSAVPSDRFVLLTAHGHSPRI